MKTTVGVLFFLGVMALAGGIEMIAFPLGGPFLPAAWLERIPVVDSYVVPGLVLTVVFGLGSLAAAVGMLTRPDWSVLAPLERITGRHWSWALTVALGIAFTAWLVIDLALLGIPVAVGDAEQVTTRVTSSLAYGVLGAVAVALLILPQTPGVRRHLGRDGPEESTDAPAPTS